MNIFNYKFNYKIINVGQRLYRFISTSPQNISLGMTNNKGKTGRFNQYQNIYYCCKSLEGIIQEQNYQEFNGSLIVSEIIEPIVLGYPSDSELFLILKGITNNNKLSEFNKKLLSPHNLIRYTDYEKTNELADKILKFFPDGIIYSSTYSPDIICCNNTIIQLNEELGLSNIALTEKGFKKIKEYNPIVYWQTKRSISDMKLYTPHK